MSYIVLIKKEAVEALRTYRLFIIAAIFVLFALASPVTAKLLPELIKSLGTNDGMVIQVATPTVNDSWIQFFSNHTQMTLIIFLITFGHSLSKELTSGTLVFLVTKGINRNAPMFAKVTYQIVLWLIGLLVSFIVTYLYNFLLFPGEDQILSNLLIYLFQLWLFGVLFIVINNFGQVLLPNALGGLLANFIFLVVFFIMTIFSELGKISPMRLVEVSAEGIENGVALSGVQGVWLFTVGIIVISLVGAVLRFKRVVIC